MSSGDEDIPFNTPQESSKRNRVKSESPDKTKVNALNPCSRRDGSAVVPETQTQQNEDNEDEDEQVADGDDEEDEEDA